MKKQVECTRCGSKYHYQTFCPSKPNKTPARSRISPPKTAKAKKPTASQVKAKHKRGEYLTVADKKILYKNQDKKAWDAFSAFIRARDCLKYTGTLEYGYCVTCKEAGREFEFPYSKLQAGHAVGGRKAAVLFHEEIVNTQCMLCNSQSAGGRSGDYGSYAMFLVKKYGVERADALQRLKTTYRDKYTYEELLEVESKYKAKLQVLIKNNTQNTLF